MLCGLDELVSQSNKPLQFELLKKYIYTVQLRYVTNEISIKMFALSHKWSD